MLHVPVSPLGGTLAFKVAVVLQMAWSGPAETVIALLFNLMLTSLLLDGQGEFVTIQVST
jgi:hypothetical protein